MRRIICLASILIFGIVGSFVVYTFPDVFAEIKPANSEQTAPPPEVVTEKAIVFFPDETFYSADIEVELTPLDPEAEIYYTLDGSNPDEKSKKYAKPIAINSPAATKATTIKAVAVKDGEKSDIVTRSYITGRDVFMRFDPETLVFVLSTDPYNLYDYHYGIAVEGYLRDEYLKEFGSAGLTPKKPANFNIRGRESERDVYVEVFDSLGERIVDQAAGIRVVGGWSRGNEQKSFRLFARNSYSDGDGMFKYPFFTNAVDSIGLPILKYDRITLRNGGNDGDQAGIRDELSLELAKQMGFPDTMEARPAAVFLNGEYYGFAWLKEAYCNGYLEQTYGGVKENYQIVSSKEDADEGEEFAVNDYQEMYKLAVDAVENTSPETSFTNDETFSKFCSMVDIENLLMFYAIQVFVDNRDWPNNNVRAWRYYPTEDEEIASPYLDGKWRFMLFDAEFGWGLYGNGYSANTLKNILTGASSHMGGQSIILTAVLQRADMQEAFAKVMGDVVGGSFRTDNVIKTLNSLAAISASEQNFALDNGNMGWVNRWSYQGNRQQIIEFANQRPAVVTNHLKSFLELSDDVSTYKIEVKNTVGGEIQLNTQKTAKSDETLYGMYFDVYEIEIGATPLAGYEFDYWEIGGKQYFEENVMVSKDLADSKGVVVATLHLKEKAGGKLPVIKKIHAAGKDDYIELYNPNETSITLKGYYLTDDTSLLDRWSIPQVTIAGESSVIITMKNNKSTESLLKLQANFNLKTGETLVLSNNENGVVSSAAIVSMNSDEFMALQADGGYKIEAEEAIPPSP